VCVDVLKCLCVGVFVEEQRKSGVEGRRERERSEKSERKRGRVRGGERCCS